MKKTPAPPVARDITIPAYDTPEASLTPLVLAAMADGATSRPHSIDPDKIVLKFGDEGGADAFEAAVNAILNPAS